MTKEIVFEKFSFPGSGGARFHKKKDHKNVICVLCKGSGFDKTHNDMCSTCYQREWYRNNRKKVGAE